jgi:hypothetical protein
VRNLFLHHLELKIGVAEVSAARANHDEEADGDVLFRTEAIRPALGVIPPSSRSDKVQPVGASAFSCNRRLHGIDTDFKVHDDSASRSAKVTPQIPALNIVATRRTEWLE